MSRDKARIWPLKNSREYGVIVSRVSKRGRISSSQDRSIIFYNGVLLQRGSSTLAEHKG
jgi:hypothetical protein